MSDTAPDHGPAPAGAGTIAQILRYRGRARRSQFWLGMMLLIAILAYALMASASYFSATGQTSGEAKIFTVILFCIAIWLQSAFIIARLRDRGRPIWWYIIYGVAPVALYYMAMRFPGEISNQPSYIAMAANMTILAIFVVGIVDLAFAGSAPQLPEQS